MCVMSMIMDYHYDKWNPRVHPTTTTGTSPNTPEWIQIPPMGHISQEELDEFHELLERARAYDKAHDQPDCELESKKEKLTKLAKDLGVEITFP